MIQQRRGRWSVVGLGSTLSGIAVVVAAITGPLLPGADSPGIIPWQDIGDEDDTRVVVSPLVDIQRRLVEQPDVQVFTVQSNDPAGSYWRLTALDTFDGQVWKSSYETDDADGELPSSIESRDVETRTVTQQITIQALAAIWLPAAFEAAAIEPDGAEVDYDDESGTLIVDRETESSDGLVYTVSSLVPAWTADQLRSAPTEYPAEVSQHLELPSGFSQRVVDEAVRLTANQPTKYDQAVALMNHFRTEFDYNLDVGEGHDGNAIEQFLFETREGYCEQFAGTYAAMMRSLDVPSRVVVGFTEGDADPNQEGLFVVKGKHAHAWVELYFPEHGWVTFDPTPTRGPGESPWLPGVEEEQVGTAPANDDSTSTTPSTAPSNTPSQGPAETADEAPVEIDDSGVQVRSDDETETGLGRFVPDELEAVSTPVGLAALVYLAVVPLAIAVMHRMRRRRAHHPTARVRLGWQEVDEEMTAAGLRLDPSLTIAERAAVMHRALPEMAPNIELLARAMEQVAYAETPPSAHQVELVDQAAAHVTGAARSRRPRWRRAISYLDARRLLPHKGVDEARPQGEGAPASAPA